MVTQKCSLMYYVKALSKIYRLQMLLDDDLKNIHMNYLRRIPMLVLSQGPENILHRRCFPWICQSFLKD